MADLEGKVAIITGAASGMGKEASLLFARNGAHVVLADLNAKGGEETAHAASAHMACVFQRTDVSREEEIERLVKRTRDEFSGLDIMFNNAGIGGAIGPLEEIGVDDWDRTQAVCLRGVFLGIKHSVKPMRARGSGAIISTASIAGVWGYPNLHAYCAAKAGVVNLTRSAALEYAADRIRVNCIAPGGISTPILYGPGGNKEAVDEGLKRAQPLDRAGQPEDIAEAALFLASHRSSFITGQTLIVDGGAVAGQRAPFRDGNERPPRGQFRFAGPSFEQS